MKFYLPSKKQHFYKCCFYWRRGFDWLRRTCVYQRLSLTGALPLALNLLSNSFSRVQISVSAYKKTALLQVLFLLAERQRFELWVGSPPRRFSRPLH